MGWGAAGVGLAQSRAEVCPCLSQQAAHLGWALWGLAWSAGEGTERGDAGDPGHRAEPSTACLLSPPRTTGDTQACGVFLTL